MIRTTQWINDNYQHGTEPGVFINGPHVVTQIFLDNHDQIFGVRVSPLTSPLRTPIEYFFPLEWFTVGMEASRSEASQQDERYIRSLNWRTQSPSSQSLLISLLQHYVAGSATHADYFTMGESFHEFLESADSNPVGFGYNISKVPEGEPYKLNTIVYDLSEIRDFSPENSGKIIRILAPKMGAHNYCVDFLRHGEINRLHHKLLPVSEHFDFHVSKEGYESLVDCNGLFREGDKFLRRGEYFYNRNQTVILAVSQFDKLFKKLTKSNDTLQKSAPVSNK